MTTGREKRKFELKMLSSYILEINFKIHVLTKLMLLLIRNEKKGKTQANSNVVIPEPKEVE
jgi:hypothetical protein